MIGNLSAMDAWDYFSGTFNRFIQQTVLMTTAAKRENNNIYITHEAKSLSKKRNLLWRKYTRSLLNQLLLHMPSLTILYVP